MNWIECWIELDIANTKNEHIHFAGRGAAYFRSQILKVNVVVDL